MSSNHPTASTQPSKPYPEGVLEFLHEVAAAGLEGAVAAAVGLDDVRAEAQRRQKTRK